MYSGYTKGMETCEFNFFNIKSLRFYPIQINPMISIVFLSSVQSLSRVWLFETPWIVARQASLSSRAVQKKKEETHKYRFLLSIIFFFFLNTFILIWALVTTHHFISCKTVLFLPGLPSSGHSFISFIPFKFTFIPPNSTTV